MAAFDLRFDRRAYATANFALRRIVLFAEAKAEQRGRQAKPGRSRHVRSHERMNYWRLRHSSTDELRKAVFLYWDSLEILQQSTRLARWLLLIRRSSVVFPMRSSAMITSFTR
jgi:hypothetical protein